MFPLAIVTVAVFGIVISEAEAQRRVVAFLVDNLPVTVGQGRDEIARALRGVTSSPGAVGGAGIVGLVFAASGLMAAARNAVNRAWDAQASSRPPLQGKLLDVALVFAAGIVVVGSLGLTVAGRMFANLGARVDGALGGGVGAAFADVLVTLGHLTTLVLAFGVFAFVYRVVPSCDVRLRDAAIGAAVAAVGFELAKTGFAIYVSNFAHYGAVYGSLGAAVAFLVFSFVAANVFVLGAEVASEWPRVWRGEYDGDGGELWPRLRRRIKGLVVRTGDVGDE